MMPMNEAMVITATSLCATWDSSWASTASSSRSSRSPCSSPVVATRTAVLLLRPVAKAFGIRDGAIATLGLGMLASAQSRSTMRVQPGRVRAVLRADHHGLSGAQRDLVGVEEGADPQAHAQQDGEEHDAAAA